MDKQKCVFASGEKKLYSKLVKPRPDKNELTDRQLIRSNLIS